MWKYTKGDERDFGGDKYPFATHMLRPIYGFGIKPFPAALNVDQDVDSKLFEVVARRERIASWGGNGLPPVGTEVECRCDEGDIKCVVLGYDFNNAAVVLRDIERKTYFAAQTTMVRPLRTERDDLPPVGTDIEYTCLHSEPGKPSIRPDKWYRGKIVAYHDGFVWTSDNGLRLLSNTKFRSCADEKRLNAINAICKIFIGDNGRSELTEEDETTGRCRPYFELYDAIVAGKIDGLGKVC